MLYILHPQRDEVTAILDNEKENTFWGELHVRDLRTSEDKFTFRMLGNTPASAALLPRSRILIPAETTGFNEFVLFKTSDTIKNIKTVTSIAAYTDMERSDNIISPGVYSGSLNELMEIAIPGTGYRTGHIEFSGFGTLEVKEYTKPYTFIKRLSELFDTELNFRIELKDNVIRGRYVDHLRRIGDDTDKEVSIGKDLVDAEISIDSNAVVTGLFCVGPEREDGTRLTTLVTNEAAYQRWNVNGAPKIDIYYADSNRQDMTLEELIESGTNELNARINAVYTYRLEAAMLEHLFPHERMSFGDRIRVINDKMMPALYARARIVRVERPISTKGKKIVEIGEVKTYTKDEILSKIRRVQNQFSIRVIKSPTPPPGDPRIIWVLKSVDTSGKNFEVAHTWDGDAWIPITPTKPEDVGAEPVIAEGIAAPINPTVGTKWLDTGADPIALKIWDGTEWATIQGPQGPPGTDGIQGPQGDQGVQGPAGADGVSSYTHIAYANSADGSIGFSVSDSDSKEYIGIYVDHIPTDSSNPAMYNWTLIKGQDGIQGLPGPKGADGLTPYFHTAWANSADGTSGFSTTDSVNKLYLGTYTDFVAADSNDPTKYSWTKIKGETGAQGPQGVPGVQGPAGPNGQSLYTWVKYATSAAGANMSDLPDGKTYIGFAYNKTTATESTNPADYTWAKIEGPQGIQGATGPNGQTLYTWLKYADSPTSGMSDSPTGKLYMGLAYNKTTSVESTNYADYSWSLIKGETGPQGNPGIQGPPGANGVSQYVHIRYSANADGSGMTTAPQANTAYIGLANTTSATAPTANTAYSWSLFKGPQGNTGIQGPAGANGVTTYTWVKYADSVAGSGISDTPSGKRFVGFAFNKTTATESNVASDYAWSPLYDNVIVGGRNLLKYSELKRYAGGAVYNDALTTFYSLNNNTVVATSQPTGSSIPGFVVDLTSDTEITLSGTTDASSGLGLYYKGYNASGVATTEQLSFTFTATNGYFNVTRTLSLPLGTAYVNVGIGSTSNANYFIKPKLEKGNIPTDWTPAPEDVDAAITNAQNTADGKNAVFYQTTQPSTAGRKVNDLWFDTDDGNRMYTFNGTTWAPVQFGTNAIAQLAITNALIANGTIQDAKIASVTAAKIVANSLSAISADLGNISAGNIQGVTILSSLFRTISALNGWVELSDGRVISADNQNNFGELRGNAIWFGNGAGNPFTGDGVNTLAFLRPLTDKSIQVDNSNGKLELGAKNTSHAHIHTDRPSVHFNKPQVTNAQETGWMAGSCINAATSANGALCGVNFRVKKTYIPSSISFDSVNSNVTPVFYDINVDGFTFGVPSMSANTLKWVRGYYTA